MAYRLPTEAEWEYACRAGTLTKWCGGNDEAGADEYAWTGHNAKGYMKEAGTRKPNAWGIHDMHGSLDEWVGDGGSNPGNGGIDPFVEPDPIGIGVVRGGEFFTSRDASMSHVRRTISRVGSYARSYTGFRVILVKSPSTRPAKKR